MRTLRLHVGNVHIEPGIRKDSKESRTRLLSTETQAATRTLRRAHTHTHTHTHTRARAHLALVVGLHADAQDRSVWLDAERGHFLHDRERIERIDILPENLRVWVGG